MASAVADTISSSFRRRFCDVASALDEDVSQRAVRSQSAARAGYVASELEDAFLVCAADAQISGAMLTTAVLPGGT